jgi:large subunit ribosomal protein L17
MRHSVYGRKLSRTKDARKRLFTGLVRDLFAHDRIVTSVAKAKAVQPIVEKLITKAKAGGEVNHRRIEALLLDRALTNTLFDEVKTRFAKRNSGYTRIIKLGKRMGDATNTALFSFVDERVKTEVIAPKKEGKNETKKVEAKGKKPAVKKVVKKTVKKA